MNLAKLKAEYSSRCNDIIIHRVKELSLPACLALCIGVKVMLIKNYIVEWKLMNDSVGTVVDTVYRDAAGPINNNTQPSYIIIWLSLFLYPSSQDCTE